MLAVPADDRTETVAMHHRSAVWPAVMTGVPVVRPNGHAQPGGSHPAWSLCTQLAAPAALTSSSSWAQLLVKCLFGSSIWL